MGAASSLKNYTNQFVKGAGKDNNIDYVNQCLDKYPEVVNTVVF